MTSPRVRSSVRPAAAQPPPRISFLSLLTVDAESACGWDRHRHDAHEVILACSDGYRCRVNGEPLALAAGELAVVQPGDWHDDRAAAGCRYHALWFSVSSGRLLSANPSPAERRAGFAIAAWEEPLGALHRLVAEGAPAARLDAEVAPLVWRLAALLPAGALAAAFAPHPATGFAAELAQAFARLGGGPATVGGMARLLGLSPRSLERRCLAELGHGPARAYARWRLARAADLLSHTDWPVRAVSDALGFANPYHFSRAFARVHGRPPTRWRA